MNVWRCSPAVAFAKTRAQQEKKITYRTFSRVTPSIDVGECEWNDTNQLLVRARLRIEINQFSTRSCWLSDAYVNQNSVTDGESAYVHARSHYNSRIRLRHRILYMLAIPCLLTAVTCRAETPFLSAFTT